MFARVRPALLLLVVTGASVGCDWRDGRIDESIERLNYSGKTPEGERLHGRLVPALENATASSLQEPYLVDAAFIEPGVVGREAGIVVYWIASDPTATGLELILDANSRHRFDFDDGYIHFNEREARHIVVFYATICLSSERLDELVAVGPPNTWTAVLVAEQGLVGNRREVVLSEHNHRQ